MRNEIEKCECGHYHNGIFKGKESILEFTECPFCDCKEFKSVTKNKGCGKMFCLYVDSKYKVCGEIDSLNNAYCSIHGRSYHGVCGSGNGLCSQCKEEKTNE